MTTPEFTAPEDLAETNLVFLADRGLAPCFNAYSGRLDIKVVPGDEALINALVHSLRIASQRVYGGRFYEPELAETVYYRREAQRAGFGYEDRPANRNLAIGYDSTKQVVYLENRNEFEDADWKGAPSEVFMKVLEIVDLQKELEESRQLIDQAR